MDKNLLKYNGENQVCPYAAENHQDFKGVRGGAHQFASRYRRWYISYLVTGTLVLFCTLLLFLFGVGGSGENLIGDFGFEKIADKVIGFIADIGFAEVPNTDSGNGELPKPNTDKDKNNPSQDKAPMDDNKDQNGDIYDFDYSLVPDGHIPIIPMDLSLTSYGDKYINNSTGYSPALEYLLNKQLFVGNTNAGFSPDKPRVLVLHTHSTEAYSEKDAVSCESFDEYGRSNDKSENVVAVGKLISDELNRQGIWSVHCTVMHDSTQYKDSYANAAETIKKYLEKYPSIELVIDVHRDAVIKSSGEVVKAVTEVDGKEAAQVMCVVGTDFGGEECLRWEDNLSLALKLRSALNGSYENICRPVTLKSSTYNQEFSKYSILLEIGTSGNSLEEAKISAGLVAQAIADLLK